MVSKPSPLALRGLQTGSGPQQGTGIWEAGGNCHELLRLPSRALPGIDAASPAPVWGWQPLTVLFLTYHALPRSFQPLLPGSLGVKALLGVSTISSECVQLCVHDTILQTLAYHIEVHKL